MFHRHVSNFSGLLLLLLVSLVIVSGCQPSEGQSVMPTAAPVPETADDPGDIATVSVDDTDILNDEGRFDCANVSEIPTNECQALVAFYEVTNGPAWLEKSGWLQTITPCSWYGLACVDGRLDMIALFFNELQGELPAALADLSALRVLDLHNNALSGAIPDDFGRLSHLESLDLSANEISGSIPADFGNLGNLRFLALAHNQLEGAIPTELGQLTRLEYLDLCDNQLNGAIPESLANLSALGTLRLNNNQLEGSIPFAFGELPAIGELDLTFNQLSGTVPYGVWQVPIHRLWGNLLEGTIQTGTDEEQDIRFLDTGFSYDAALATSVWPELEPALPLTPGPGLPWARPEHLSFTFVSGGEPQERSPMGLYLPAEAQLHFFPTDALNEEVQPEVAALRQLLAERPNLDTYETAAADAPPLPLLPPSNALQMFRAQAEYLSFANGSGVRYLTQLAQGMGPINNQELFYTFQGLTDDGTQYVTLFYPVAAPDLPASPTAENVDYLAFQANWESYVTETVQMLNGQPAAAFLPDLALLDELVRSITITPAAAELEGVWPENGESVDVEPILQWASFPGVDRYEVVVVDDDAFPPVVAYETTTAETSVPVTPALVPGSYSWTVRALDADGATLAELNRQFWVKALMGLIEPADGAEVGDSPLLRWESYPDATQYYVFLLHGYPPQMVFETTVTATEITITPPLLAGEFYYWSVWAQDDQGNTLAELNSSFTVEDAASD